MSLPYYPFKQYNKKVMFQTFKSTQIEVLKFFICEIILCLTNR